MGRVVTLSLMRNLPSASLGVCVSVLRRKYTSPLPLWSRFGEASPRPTSRARSGRLLGGKIMGTLERTLPSSCSCDVGRCLFT